MRPKIISFILLISLAFNAGFIVRFLHIKASGSQSLMMPARLQTQLRERTALSNDVIRDIRNENMGLRRLFFSELSKPDVNMREVNSLIWKIFDSQSALEYAVLNHFVVIRRDMETEEAEEFFGRLSRRQDNPGNRTRRDRNRSTAEERGISQEQRDINQEQRINRQRNINERRNREWDTEELSSF